MWGHVMERSITPVLSGAGIPALGISLILFACADPEPLLTTAGTGSQVQNINLLHLAGNESQALETPWVGQDQNLLDTIRNRTPQQFGGRMARVVTETQFPCSGGGLQTRTVNNQAPPWFSAGDVYTTTYQDCVLGATLINGARIFSVDSMTGQPYVDSTWETTTTMSRQGFSRTNTVTGNVSLAEGRVTTSLAGTQLATNPGWFAYVQTTSSEFSRQWDNNGATQTRSGSTQISYRWEDTPASAFEWEFDVSLSSSQFGDSAARTLSVLTGIRGQPPESGQLEISRTGIDGVTQRSLVTAIGAGNVRVETDIDNDGVIDTTQTMSWNQLVIEPLLYQIF